MRYYGVAERILLLLWNELSVEILSYEFPSSDLLLSLSFLAFGTGGFLWALRLLLRYSLISAYVTELPGTFVDLI